MNLFEWIAFIYLIIVNIVGFAAMGIDKSKAKRKAWRIPEKTLFLISIIGGSLGTLTGMYLFRHKTRHWYFVVFMPMILLVHIIIVVKIIL
jgi:Predicted membrane protein